MLVRTGEVPATSRGAFEVTWRLMRCDRKGLAASNASDWTPLPAAGCLTQAGAVRRRAQSRRDGPIRRKLISRARKLVDRARQLRLTDPVRLP